MPCITLFPWIQPNSLALGGLTQTTLPPQPLRRTSVHLCAHLPGTLAFVCMLCFFGIWFYFIFYSTEDGTQGLGHTRQTLYPLSYVCSP